MRRTTRLACGLALSAAVHLGLLLALGLSPGRALEAAPGRVMQLIVVAPRARTPVATMAPALPAIAPAPPAPATPPPEPEAPARADLYYFFPQELDRELIVLRDRSGDVDIALPTEVSMHVFVGIDGKVAAISFDGEPPAPALADALKTAFGSMEFMPGMRQGNAVPSRIKIVIAPHPVIDTKVY